MPELTIGNIVVNLIVAAIAGIIGYFIKNISKTIKEYRSEFTGTWRDEIKDENGEIIKVNEYKLKHNRKKNTIKGTIRRIYPANQLKRKYVCSGYIYNNLILLCGKTIGERSTSCACWMLNITNEADYKLTGIYIKPSGNLKDPVNRIAITLYKMAYASEAVDTTIEKINKNIEPYIKAGESGNSISSHVKVRIKATVESIDRDNKTFIANQEGYKITVNAGKYISKIIENYTYNIVGIVEKKDDSIFIRITKFKQKFGKTHKNYRAVYDDKNYKYKPNNYTRSIG